MTDYLTALEVVSMHAELIRHFGGEPGLRDAGLLESALFRPQTGYYDDLIAEAAALWESLSQNHPFVDGNKRGAFAATHAFLQLNGITITAEAEQTWLILLSLYEGDNMTFDRLDAWLRKNTAEAEQENTE